MLNRMFNRLFPHTAEPIAKPIFKVFMNTETGMYNWRPNTQVQLTDNFWCHEFDSPDRPSWQMIDKGLVTKLQLVRQELGMPITITSGYRSESYNKHLAKLGYKVATTVSQHTLGKAVDITCRDLDKLLGICEKHFDAIGRGTTFLHVDLRDDKTRRWGY